MLHGPVSVSEIMAYLSQDRYLSLSESSAYLGLSVRTIRKFLPEIPHFKVGSKLLFKRSELDAWIFRYREHGEGFDLDRLADEALKGLLESKN
jgi:excisionase family DNA binding protein